MEPMNLNLPHGKPLLDLSLPTSDVLYSVLIQGKKILPRLNSGTGFAWVKALLDSLGWATIHVDPRNSSKCSDHYAVDIMIFFFTKYYFYFWGFTVKLLYYRKFGNTNCQLFCVFPCSLFSPLLGVYIYTVFSDHKTHLGFRGGK